MLDVVIDANVLISYVFLRDEAQQDLAETLFLRAREEDLVVALPQFVIFEAIFVFRSFYKLAPHGITAMLREAIALPGLTLVDDCPWPALFEQPARKRLFLNASHHPPALSSRPSQWHKSGPNTADPQWMSGALAPTW